jgi:hypothetical protein
VTQASASTVTKAKPSRKLIATWSGSYNLAIWEDCDWTVRLYEDRALVEMPSMKRSRSGDNSWYLGTEKYSINEPGSLQALKRLASNGADSQTVLVEICPEWTDR